MTWILAGVAALLFLPALVAVLLAILHVWLQKHYLQFIVRIYTEVPYFNGPRGQPRPEAEDVTFPTGDGLALRGCYFKTPHSRRGVVVFGLEYNANRWSCAPYCDHLVDAGYDVFAYDPRNQGDSAREDGLQPLHWPSDRDVADARAALAYLKARPDADPRGVGWFGVSKGAGAGLLAAADDPYIRCAAFDGMFSITYTVVPYMRRWVAIYNKSYMIQGILPSWYYATLARVAMRRVEVERRVRFLDLEPALRRFRRPLLMMHGQRDGYIRPDMSRRLFAVARGTKEYWLIPGANHNQGQHVAADEYRKRVGDFFDKYLADSKPARGLATVS